MDSQKILIHFNSYYKLLQSFKLSLNNSDPLWTLKKLQSFKFSLDNSDPLWTVKKIRKKNIITNFQILLTTNSPYLYKILIII